MKNLHASILCCFFLIITSTLCKAQLQKGTSFFGFDLNYNTHKTKYDNGTLDPDHVYNFSIMPSFGVFVGKHVLVGIQTEWTKNKLGDIYNGNISVTDQRSKGHSFGSFVRYYNKLGEKAVLFFQGELLWRRENRSYEITDTQATVGLSMEDKLKGFQAGLRPGIAYFITNRLSIESTFGFIGYVRVKSDNNLDGFGFDNNSKDFQMSLNSGTLNFGIRYYIPAME